MKNNLGTVSRYKKVADAHELKLYQYVDDKALKVCHEIAQQIKSTPVDQGKLIVVTGPMNSGKSIVAIRLPDILKEVDAKRKAVNIQPLLDRPDIVAGKIYSRLGITSPAISFSTKQEIEDIFYQNDIVIVDEFQFIPYDLQSYFVKEARQFMERGGWVIAIGLKDTAVNGEFIISALLIERADYVYSLVATCQMCGKKNAVYSQRLINNRAASDKDDLLVNPSAKVTYEPRCRDCLVI